MMGDDTRKSHRFSYQQTIQRARLRLKRMSLREVSLILFVFILFLCCKALIFNQNPSNLSLEKQLAASQLHGNKRKRKKPRQHLYEICPHTVLDFSQVSGERGEFEFKHAKAFFLQKFHTEFEAEVVQDKDGTSKEGLTMVQRGDIPVILSVPHGANTKDSSYSWQQRNLASRGSGEAVDADSFQSRLSRVNSDTFTYELGKGVSKAYAKLYGKKPYIVAARFHRRFVDVNRRLNVTEKGVVDVSTCCEAMFPKCTAVSDGTHPDAMRARDVYLTYHYRIIQILGEIKRRFVGQPVLFVDIHAQRAVADEALDLDAEYFETAVIAGTQDGRCVRSREKLYRKSGLLHQFDLELKVAGIGQIYPPNNQVKDHPKYNGGHIVAEYGFNNTVGLEVDAVQLEFGYKLRMKSKYREKAAVALAKAIKESDYTHPKQTFQDETSI